MTRALKAYRRLEVALHRAETITHVRNLLQGERTMRPQPPRTAPPATKEAKPKDDAETMGKGKGKGDKSKKGKDKDEEDDEWR